jgi:hypothetical protein
MKFETSLLIAALAIGAIALPTPFTVGEVKRYVVSHSSINILFLAIAAY